jgi:hypothetical protein
MLSVLRGCKNCQEIYLDCRKCPQALRYFPMCTSPNYGTDADKVSATCLNHASEAPQTGILTKLRLEDHSKGRNGVAVRIKLQNDFATSRATPSTWFSRRWLPRHLRKVRWSALAPHWDTRVVFSSTVSTPCVLLMSKLQLRRFSNNS